MSTKKPTPAPAAPSETQEPETQEPETQEPAPVVYVTRPGTSILEGSKCLTGPITPDMLQGGEEAFDALVKAGKLVTE